MLVLCLHKTSPLARAHHPNDKRINNHTTMANLSPSADGPPVAEAW